MFFFDKPPPAIIVPAPKELLRPRRELLTPDKAIVPAISFISSGRFGGGAVASNTFITNSATAPASSTHTYTSISIGTADATRRVVVGVSWQNITGTTLSSVTIAGTGATIHANQATGAERCAIASALVPTGTTANIVFTFNASTSRSGINVWSQINETTSTPFATATVQNNGTPTSTTINIPSNGCLYCQANADTSPAPVPTFTWTGATERSDTSLAGSTTFAYSGASETGLGSQTNRSISIAMSGSSPFGGLACVSWN